MDGHSAVSCSVIRMSLYYHVHKPHMVIMAIWPLTAPNMDIFYLIT